MSQFCPAGFVDGQPLIPDATANGVEIHVVIGNAAVTALENVIGSRVGEDL
jgi:hypothetical protein